VSFAADLIQRGEAIEAAADTLLERFSKIWKWAPDAGAVAFVTPTPFGWEDLPPEGMLLQRELLRKFDTWSDLVDAVVSGGSAQATRDARGAREEIRQCLDQSTSTFLESVGDARRHVAQHFEEIRNLLIPLGSSGGPAVVIPDTNALLHNPDLNEWSFPDLEPLAVLLLPTVLSELDRLKILHRNEAVRQKAESLIRRIKGYRTRGRLTDGVPLRSGRSTIRAEARELLEMPLPWLDPSVDDDRILGAALHEIIREPGRQIVLVTRDINLQNKAEFAAVPFREPPDRVG
jgi:hypothetical protein